MLRFRLLRFRLFPAPFLTWTLSACLLGGAANAACDTLAFFPPVTNTYSMTSAAGTSSMTTTTTQRGDSATSTTTVGGRTSTVTWTCTGRGLTAKLGSSMEMKTAYFPPLSAWKVGYVWTGDSEMGAASGMKVKASSRSRIAALEQVKTPAGSFRAYRVETDTTTAVQMPAGTKLPPGAAKAMNSVTHSVAWYAVGVGVVRQQLGDNTMSMLLVKTSR